MRRQLDDRVLFITRQQRQWVALTLGALVLTTGLGCRNAVIRTTMRMTSDMAVTKDVTPLREHTVVPGGSSGFKIALVDVDGVLLNANLTGLSSVGENPVEMFREKLDVVARSQCYSAVVVRINSPGGGVTASDIMRRDLIAFKARTGLPVVACLMDLGAGGAYYLATACDQIVAHPTTVTGGLGVLLNIYDMQDTMGQINVIPLTIRTGKYVDLGSPVHTMENEGEEILTQVAEEFHHRFQRVIREARSLPAEGLPLPEGPGQGQGQNQGQNQGQGQGELVDPLADVFDGRIMTAHTAMGKGLIDSIGFVDDAIHTARELGGAMDAKAVILHRWRDPARTPYAITPNVPRSDLLPLSIPGLERSRLPTFLYMWQPDPSLERWGGR